MKDFEVRSPLKVEPYDHDSLPVPYTGTGEEYSVYPGNVRTRRHRISLTLDVLSRDVADEVAVRIAAVLADYT